MSVLSECHGLDSSSSENPHLYISGLMYSLVPFSEYACRDKLLVSLDNPISAIFTTDSRLNRIFLTNILYYNIQ